MVKASVGRSHRRGLVTPARAHQWSSRAEKSEPPRPSALASAGTPAQRRPSPTARPARSRSRGRGSGPCGQGRWRSRGRVALQDLVREIGREVTVRRRGARQHLQRRVEVEAVALGSTPGPRCSIARGRNGQEVVDEFGTDARPDRAAVHDRRCPSRSSRGAAAPVPRLAQPTMNRHSPRSACAAVRPTGASTKTSPAARPRAGRRRPWCGVDGAHVDHERARCAAWRKMPVPRPPSPHLARPWQHGQDHGGAVDRSLEIAAVRRPWAALGLAS
jgi:hypothetical protein